ncbi:hypothetical protein Plhal304r1_c050g0132391 [Plasmopara halstedii]
MKSPVKDIMIGITLGIGVGLIWRDWKGGEMDRISRYYKWQESQKDNKNFKLNKDD